jgi:hypothetical protein
MELSLNETQRLNLHFMMGSQRGSVDEIRLWWRLQDSIALSDEEKKAINYRTVKVGDVEQPTWETAHVKARRFEFTTDEVGKLERLVREWQFGYTAGDRAWLEPLLAQLEPPKVNGSGTDQTPIHTRNRSRDDRVQQ